MEVAADGLKAFPVPAEGLKELEDAAGELYDEPVDTAGELYEELLGDDIGLNELATGAATAAGEL